MADDDDNDSNSSTTQITPDDSKSSTTQIMPDDDVKSVHDDAQASSSSIKTQQSPAAVEMTTLRWPAWVFHLFEEHDNFFTECSVHPTRTCECCCLRCLNGPLCAECLTSDHPEHKYILMISYPPCYVAIIADDMQLYLDVKSVETHEMYGNSKFQVVFLDKKPPELIFNADDTNNACRACHGGVKPGYTFCTIRCMVNGPSERPSITIETQPKRAREGSSEQLTDERVMNATRGNPSPSS